MFASSAGATSGTGMELLTPTSVSSTGTGNTTTVNANGSITFSTCDSVTVNGVFSASYDNYVIVVRRNGAGAVTSNFRLRVGGVDNSTASSYTTQENDISGTSESGYRIATTSGYFSQHAGGIDAYVAYLYGPFLTQATAWRSTTFMATSSARILDCSGTHNQATSYDGITFTTLSAGTGLISIYGLVN